MGTPSSKMPHIFLPHVQTDNMVVVRKDPLMIKLIDFGKSKSDEGSMGNTFHIGTHAFMAPEVERSGLAGAQYDCFQADMWSCGALLFFLIYSKYAWFVFEVGKDPVHFRDAFLRGDWRSQVPSYAAPISPGCVAMLDALLRPEPGERMSAGDVLRQPWTLAGMPPWLAERMGRPVVERPIGAQSEEDIKAIIRAGPK